MEKLTRRFINNNATRGNALLLTVLRWYQIYKGEITYYESTCAACEITGKDSCRSCVLSRGGINPICDDIINDAGLATPRFAKNIYRRLLYFAGFTSIKKYKASVPKKYHKFF